MINYYRDRNVGWIVGLWVGLGFSAAIPRGGMGFVISDQRSYPIPVRFLHTILADTVSAVIRGVPTTGTGTATEADDDAWPLIGSEIGLLDATTTSCCCCCCSGCWTVAVI